MSLNLANPNIPFIIKFNTDLIVGAIIRKGGASAEVANAQKVTAVAGALQTINSGDVVNGLSALDAALSAGSTDPATEAAIQTAVAWIASKAAAIQQFLSGTITGSEIAQLNGQVLSEAVAVAAKYLQATPAPVIVPPVPPTGTAA